MRKASAEYRESMRKPFRNRGYIRATIGVVNLAAEEYAKVSPDSKQSYVSTPENAFQHIPVLNQYATTEMNFSSVGGKMFFPPTNPDSKIYSNGIVSEMDRTIKIEFGSMKDLDIKGLTIDFGECYPTKFSITTNTKTYNYINSNRHWQTEDVFDNVSFMTLQATDMKYPNTRLRILDIVFGIANSFTNANAIGYNEKQYISPTSETLPSTDINLTVKNSEGYYNADDPNSAIAYMQAGDEIKIQFGYDVTGNNDIEWISERKGYLSSWSANEKEAKFIATDQFTYMNSKYCKGKYYVNGIDLYALAEDVLRDAGIKNYKIDTYLKNIVVYNPIPIVTHAEALQIIANAARAILCEDNEGIVIKYTGDSDLSATCNGEAELSKIQNVLNKENKFAYAMTANEFTSADGRYLFRPAQAKDYKACGYVSLQLSNNLGIFETPPLIFIQSKNVTTIFGLNIEFEGKPPIEFQISSYTNDAPVKSITVTNPGSHCHIKERFENINYLELKFIKSHPHSKIAISKIYLDETSDYTITKNMMLDNPNTETKEKISEINIVRSRLSESTEGIKELTSDEIEIDGEHNEIEIFFDKPCYDYQIVIPNEVQNLLNTNVSILPLNNNVIGEIIEEGAYYLKIKFYGVTSTKKIKYTILGKEYSVGKAFYRKRYNQLGKLIEWKNPLVSEYEMAYMIEKWLASYYLGETEYKINWRGDPIIEANDLLLLERNHKNVLIRAYENSISFNGAWKGTVKSRKAVL